MTEYDQRQYAWMRSKIHAFRKEELSLRHLIGDLNGLLGMLESADSAVALMAPV